MSKKQKLELTWIGKEERPRLEPRILLEDQALSYHAGHRVTEADLFDNRLIYGDNLLALKALEQEFAGKVKCVFIDPPYNLPDDDLDLVLRTLVAHLADDASVVVERSTRSPAPTVPDGLELVRTKTYGETAVHLFAPV